MDTSLSITGYASPPEALLSDGVVELRVIEVIDQDGAADRPPEAQLLARVPECRFAVYHVEDSVRVGRIEFRLSRDRQLLRTLGHVRFAIDEPYRANGYSTRALRLAIGLARLWNLMPMWLLIEPDNTVARRVAVRAGFELVEEAVAPTELRALGIGPVVCRYRFTERCYSDFMPRTFKYGRRVRV